MSRVIQLKYQNGIAEADLDRLRAGDSVELTGQVISVRDASAARLAAAVDSGQPLPISIEGQVLYAVGPSPAKPGQIIGSAGPTTTSRMTRFLPSLFKAGARAIIGKGELHGDGVAPFLLHGAVYLGAVGGLGALLAEQISSTRIVAYDDLGPEALYALQIFAFPVVVIIDRHGGNFHEIARARWRKA
jgi:fumarate hydratase subunit beta